VGDEVESYSDELGDEVHVTAIDLHREQLLKLAARLLIVSETLHAILLPLLFKHRSPNYVSSLLDDALYNGELREGHIFTQSIKTGLEMMAYYTMLPDSRIGLTQPAYPPIVVSMLQTLLRVANESTLHFLRGPGSGSIAQPWKWDDFVFPFVQNASTVARKVSAGHTPKEGISRPLLQSLHTLLLDPTQRARPAGGATWDPRLQMYPLCTSNDTMAVTPSIEADETWGLFVGTKGPIIGPQTVAEAIKEGGTSFDLGSIASKMITNMGANFVQTVDGAVRMGIGASFATRINSGDEALTDTYSSNDMISICVACLSNQPVDCQVLTGESVCVRNSCEACRTRSTRWGLAMAQFRKVKASSVLPDIAVPPQPAACAACRELGHRFALPALRCCDACACANKQCVRCEVVVFVTDGEGYCRRSQIVHQLHLDDATVDSKYLLLVGLPDVTHLLKNLRSNAYNYDITIDGQSVGMRLALLAMASDPVFSAQIVQMGTLRRALNPRDTQSIVTVGQTTQLGALFRNGLCPFLTTTISPELIRMWAGNTSKEIVEPIAVLFDERPRIGMFLITTNNIFGANVHSPRDLVPLSQLATRPSGAAVAGGVLFLCDVDGVAYLEITPGAVAIIANNLVGADLTRACEKENINVGGLKASGKRFLLAHALAKTVPSRVLPFMMMLSRLVEECEKIGSEPVSWMAAAFIEKKLDTLMQVTPEEIKAAKK